MIDIVGQEVKTILVEASNTSTPKKPKLTEADQRNLLVEMLLPVSKLKGKIVVVSIPTGTHGLKPSKNEPDFVREWANDQFHQKYGKAPTSQAYKAACTSIGVALQSCLMEELAGCEPNFEYDCSPEQSERSNFESLERIDGHDNLYIFTLANGKGTIGRLKIRVDKETGEEYEEMSPLWGPDTFPVVHEVLDVEDATEGAQTHYDVTIAGRRRTLPSETWKSGNWYDFFPGITGVLDSSKEKLYKAALMQVASKAPRVAAFETTGLKKVSTTKGTDEWVFILPDGRFIARKGADLATFKVRMVHDILSPEEKRVWQEFTLPTELPSQEQRQSAYNYMRDIAPRGQGLMILSHMIGASLYELRTANFGPAHVMVVEAPKGAGKTTLSGLARSIVYPFQGQKPTADSAYQGTVTSIEDDLTYRSSMPVIVDDFVLKGNTETKKKEMAMSLEAFSRAVFNVMPVRKRMRSSRSGLKKQRSNYVRTLPTTTVEGLPEMPESWFRRVLIVTIKAGEIIKKSDGRTDIAALDQMGEYASTLQGWGHIGIIQFFLARLATEGLDKVTKKFEALYRQAVHDIREAVIAKWDNEQKGNTLPDDWHSIGDSGAYDLFYFRLFRMIGCRDIETSDSDVLPHLVDMIYQQLLRMENRTPDEEGLFLFEKALLSLFEDIRSGKIENSQRWRVDHKVPATGPIEPPQVWTKGQKYMFPSEYWGWTPEMRSVDDNDDHPVRVPQSCTVAYIDDTMIYLTDRARKELLKIISKLPGGENIASEKALGELAEKEGWIIKRGDSRQRAFKIVPPQGATRVWGLSLEKFLAHHQDIPDSELVSDSERPDNVHDFPAKDHAPDNDEDYDPFTDENAFL